MFLRLTKSQALKSAFLILFSTSLFSTSLKAQDRGDTWEKHLKLYDRDDIHSIHRKLYTKEDRHEVGLGVGGIFNNGGYALLTASYTYHLYENLGFEAALGGFGFQFGDDNRLMTYQASLNFSPLYGKVSLFTWAVANYDLYFVGGLGVVTYSGQQDGSSLAGNIGIGERFFLNDWLSFKVEFRDYIYRRKFDTDTRVLHNYSLVGGLSVMLPFTPQY